MGTTVMDRPTTGAIKGVALICMFIHHFFTFPEWYISGISYPELEGFAEFFCEPMKICVPTFAFLTGYVYSFAKKKSLGYSIQKITEFLTTYWTVYLVLLTVAIALGCHQFGFSRFVYELAGIYKPIMIFCWYVHFYCTSMLLLPVLNRFSRGTLFGDFLLFLVLPSVMISRLMPAISSSVLVELLTALSEWFPCTASGYLVAKYDLFQRTFGRIAPKNSNRMIRYLYLLGLVCLAALGRNFAPMLFLFKMDTQWTMDIVYAALFVYAWDQLLQMCRNTPVFSLLGKIGGKSTIMWFVHCMFFNVCSSKTQMLLYWPGNPLLELLNGLLICYLASRILSVPVGYLQTLRKKVFGLLQTPFVRHENAC